jgi:hypothetical protein
MPIAQALVTRYFQLIVSRQFAEAERELERVKQKMQKTEWNRGYFRALYGMYLSRKNAADDYAFFAKVDFSDKVALNDFDRGYFSAWADCMRIISRMNIPAPEKATEEKSKIETTRTDKSQATIANFLEETQENEKAVEEEHKLAQSAPVEIVDDSSSEDEEKEE